MSVHKIIRRRDLKPYTGFGPTKIYEMIAAKEFPAPVRLGRRAVGWLTDEVDLWLEARRQERDSRAA